MRTFLELEKKPIRLKWNNKSRANTSIAGSFALTEPNQTAIDFQELSQRVYGTIESKLKRTLWALEDNPVNAIDGVKEKLNSILLESLRSINRSATGSEPSVSRAIGGIEENASVNTSSSLNLNDRSIFSRSASEKSLKLPRGMYQHNCITFSDCFQWFSKAVKEFLQINIRIFPPFFGLWFWLKTTGKFWTNVLNI